MKTSEKLLDTPISENPRIIYTDVGSKWQEVEAKIAKAEEERGGLIYYGDINRDPQARRRYEEMKVMKPILEQIRSRKIKPYAIIAPHVQLCCDGDRPGRYILQSGADHQNIKLLVGHACFETTRIEAVSYCYIDIEKNTRKIEFGDFDKLKIRPEMTLRELLRRKVGAERKYLKKGLTFEDRLAYLESLFKQKV